METLTGTSLPVFIGVTLMVMGFACFMTGQGLANTWKPAWQAVLYTLLLGFADRFLVWSLFESDLLSVTGYVVDTAVLLAICLVAYRSTKAHRMVSQYPWIYERNGLFGWRRKAGT